MKIITHTDATHWLVRELGPPNPSGPVVVDHTGMGTLTLWEWCTSRQFNPTSDVSGGVTWDFEHDPYGSNALILPFDTTHPVPRQNGVIGDDYPISTNILAAPTIHVGLASSFAGITGLSLAAEALQPHPNHGRIWHQRVIRVGFLTHDHCPVQEMEWGARTRTFLDSSTR